MTHGTMMRLAFGLLIACAVVPLWGCAGQQQAAEQGTAAQEVAVEQDAAAADEPAATKVADGTYDIEVETDSSMFRSESCKLTVADGTYRVELVLPGEGFSKLYWGSAADAEKAADADVCEYRLNDDGKYTFDLTVSALDEELPIAAFGHRRDKWYDHTITFRAPAASGAAAAAEGAADAA